MKPKFPEEFKQEAVKQVIDRGYSVSDVAKRLGVSIQSLYKWVKAVKPDKQTVHDEELLASKREVLKLKEELRHTQEERDILKKAARYFAGGQGKVCLY